MMSIEEQDALLHTMSAKDLRALVAQGEWTIYYNEDDETFYEEAELSVQGTLVQEPPAPELKKLIGMKTKMEKTGLTQAQIILIETDKSKASLSEIMLYCKGLNIEFADFLPELFEPV